MQIKTFVLTILLLLTLDNTIAENGSMQQMETPLNNLYNDFKNYISLVELFKQYYSGCKEALKNRIELNEMYTTMIEILKNNKTELQQQLADKNNIIETQINALQLKTKEIDELRATNLSIVSNNTQFSICERQLAEKETEQKRQNAAISELKLDNQKLQTELSTLTYTSQSDKAEISESHALIGKLEFKVTTLTDQINNMQQQISELEFRVKSNDKTIAEQKLLLASYANSSSTNTSCEAFGNSTDVHVIQVKGVGPFQVSCDGQLAGPGWTVIQRRIDGSVNFYRNWTEYKEGFGNVTGEYFLGLEKIHQMTASEIYELYIYMEDFEGDKRFVKYDHFSVGNELESYTLKSVGEYEGNAEDALQLSVGQKFSTLDLDNDNDTEVHCAQYLSGAWWYNNCGLINLNGVYKQEDDIYEEVSQTIFWDSLAEHSAEIPLKSVQMMIRPKRA